MFLMHLMFLMYLKFLMNRLQQPMLLRQNDKGCYHLCCNILHQELEMVQL
jgi:hypothetical protein